MDAIVECCCGLDVHQATVVACLLKGSADARPKKTVRTFRTVTRELLELRDWLQAEGCTHIGMESTGVYWRPVYAVLEDSFALVVGNARHIKNVPGRKTDVKDSEWIADLLRHGLIAKSFVPPRPIRELRDLTRYRRKLVQSRSGERNRLQKLLETCNVKLASFLSNVFGVSGMDMLRALVTGELTPSQMAQMARGTARKKVADLELALEGRLEEHHRFLLRMQLDRLGEIDAHIAAVEAEIDRRLEPHLDARERLQQLPGFDKHNSANFIAEAGADMSVFPTAGHFASWAGVCPGNNESAGRSRGSNVRCGNVNLTTALVEAAQAAIRKKKSYLRDKFFRLKARRGYKRALLAIAHKLLVAAYKVLAGQQDYRDLGEGYLDGLDRRKTAKALVARLDRLGYDVTLAPKAA